MTRNEAVQKLATAGRLSIAHAEDLYDSIVPKPVVPRYVADWYEEHKNGLDYDLWEYLVDWSYQKPSDFKDWMARGGKAEPVITLVNMHQFGYEVEKETRYTVQLKGLTSKRNYLNHLVKDGMWYFNDSVSTTEARTHHTKKELEEGGFGEVFDSPLFEVKEVTDE